jgi:hypothetical protein
MAFDSAHPLFQTTDTFQQLIQDLNYFGDNVDSDLSYLDSAIGPGGTKTLRGLDDFTAGTLVDALNELDSDLHGSGGGSGSDLTTQAKTIVGAINEVEAVFDASAETITTSANLTVDAGEAIILDADDGDIFLKDAGVTFGSLTNNSGNLILKSGSTTAMTFSGASVTVAGSITLPSSGTGSITASEISANTVHGAIDEINARIPNVYNRSSVLLNP